jgi:type II secretory pathway component PulM
MQLLLQKLGWQGLEKREKMMVAGLGGMVALLLLYTFLLAPLLSTREDLQKSLAKKEVELLEIKNLQQEYRILQSQSTDIKGRISSRAKDFTLFSYIEQHAALAKVKKNIKYLKPSEVEREGVLQEARVDMQLEQISTESLVAFLKGLESEENVIYVSRLSIKEYGKEKGYLNVVIQLITFQLKDGDA